MTAVELRHNSVDIDPDWYAGQPETAEEAQPGEAEAAPSVTVPTVLTKLQKWGDYESWGEPVWPSRFIPMKTPLSQEILDNWQLSNPPKHRLTVDDILAAQAAAGRHVGLILDLSNHDCLYLSDVPPTVDYLHVQLVAKELPPLEFVQEVGRAANQHWRQHKDSYIAVHCAYGFNRTGFVVCSYLIEHCGLSVDQALQSFARSRPPGVKHEKFKNELHARYGVRNMHIQRPVHSCGPVCVVCGEASCSTSSSSTAAVNQPSASTAAAADSEYSSAAAVQDCSSGTSAAAEDCTSSGAGQQPAAAAPARTASVLSTGSEQPLAAELRLSRCSSNSSQKPPPPPQLAQLLTSSSIDAYTLPRIPDSSSTPLPVISGRCYSSGSMGDNSSIGCSPDSTADVLLTGTSSNHSSVGYAAGRFPLAAGRQQQQAVVPGLHGFSRRSALQSSSVHSSQGRLGCSAPATAPAAAAVAIDAAAAGSRTGTDSKPQSRNSSGSALASDQCNDADAFDIDPCGEERDDDSSSSWQGDRTAGSTRNGWCAEGPSSEEQQRQQQRQQQQQLSDLMAAVRLGQQQQQQPAGQYCTDVTTAGGNRQQHTADASAAGSAASAATAAVVECSCSCHTAVAAARRSSHDGGVWQTQLRYSLMSTGEGRQPQELADNESFGRVTTADMLMSLRTLQDQHKEN